SIRNETPLAMTIHDAVVRDNVRIVPVNGELITFEPGNVFVNNTKRTDAEDSTGKTISIVQDSFASSFYDFGSLDASIIQRIFDLDQDLYITGDVINEDGAL